MLLRIDPASGVPLAEQIASQIRGAIADGGVLPGERLAAARELAKALDVNMHTVLRAYAQLRDEGLLAVRPGRGAVVSGTAAAGRARLVQAVQDLLAEGRRLGMSTEELIDEVRRWA